MILREKRGRTDGQALGQKGNLKGVLKGMLKGKPLGIMNTPKGVPLKGKKRGNPWARS